PGRGDLDGIEAAGQSIDWERPTSDLACSLRAIRSPQGATLSSYSMGWPKPSVWTPSWRRASKAINRRCALYVMMWAKTPPFVKVLPVEASPEQISTGFGNARAELCSRA